ncbi:MAG: TRAP transporter large permease subunit [Rhodospirillaceae bacterium]
MRAGTVGLALIVSLLAFSESNLEFSKDAARVSDLLVNGVMLALLAVSFYLWITLMLEQDEAFVDFSTTVYIWGYVGFALTFILTLRHFGVPLFVVSLFAFVVIVFGHLIPESVAIPDFGWTRVSENIWYSFDGVFGRLVAVVGQIVLIFIIFGAIQETSGAGATMLKFAFAVTGRMRGGPAHAAIIGSAMFGTMNGAAVANVVSTGVFTIPMIKRTRFQPKFAGAVESAASTGGQIMPSVMGAVAFLMADITGIPYLEIIVAAAIPAILYYLSLFSVVWLEARKRGIAPVPAADFWDGELTTSP